MGLSKVTLIIPTHNRHGYLARILEYYRDVAMQMVVVDSSSQPFTQENTKIPLQYYHLPGMPMPQKMKFALERVETPFVVFCSDDDFVLPQGIQTCVDFLQSHPQYASAQGNSITYKKRKRYSDFIEINPLYDEVSRDISMNDPFERLQFLFSSYRTVFSAVHYSEVMNLAYADIDPGISNLFLNEYITSIVPIVAGKHKELPVFYQLREYAEDSGDKVTENLDVVYRSSSYADELSLFLDYVAQKISVITGLPVIQSKNNLDLILRSFSEQLEKQKTVVKEPASKKIGKLIALIPVLGERIVMKRRLKMQEKKISEIVRTSEDQRNLHDLKRLIFKYEDAVG